MNTQIKSPECGRIFQKYAPNAIALLCLLTIISATSFFTQGWDLIDLSVTALSGLSALVLLLNLQLTKGQDINPRKKGLIKIMHRCSYVPYLFGIYLFVFKGFLGLTVIAQSFSVMLTAMTLFYMLCGHFVVNAGYQSCPMANHSK